MKKDKTRSKEVNTNSRRKNLPLLRGMFVCPEPVKRLKKIYKQEIQQIFHDLPDTFRTTDTVQQMIPMTDSHNCISDDGLFLTAEESRYFGYSK